MAKCSVMVYRTGKEVDCNVFGTPVPALQQYTYLIPKTIGLDLTANILDRKEKETNVYLGIRLFLTRRHIPALIRSRFVRSVLVPIALYGCELY